MYAWTLRGIDQQLLEVQRVAASGSRAGHAAPGSDANARDELGHRQRLDEVVVGSRARARERGPLRCRGR